MSTAYSQHISVLENPIHTVAGLRSAHLFQRGQRSNVHSLLHVSSANSNHSDVVQTLTQPRVTHHDAFPDSDDPSRFTSLLFYANASISDVSQLKGWPSSLAFSPNTVYGWLTEERQFLEFNIVVVANQARWVRTVSGSGWVGVGTQNKNDAPSNFLIQLTRQRYRSTTNR